ncbi:MAG TPA: hypothetical protein VIH47_02675 [Solirubrobacterales bacterium]
MILIDEIMPVCDRRELHRCATTAPARALWDAVHDLEGSELRLMRALMGLRTLGRSGGDEDRTVLEGFERMGFRKVAEQPGEELVIAGIGRFWKPSGGLRRVQGREQFASFAEPGFAKVAFNFRLVNGELSTETRIAGTDAQARRRFGLYWLLIRPGSGLIRREWLRAIANRAESAHPDSI